MVPGPSRAQQAHNVGTAVALPSAVQLSGNNMGKWLAIGAIAILVLLLILWRQLDDSEATPHKAASSDSKSAPTMASSDSLSASATKVAAPVNKTETAAPAQAAPPGKQVMDMGSDLFYKHFLDIIPKRLWKDAAVCYEGKLGTHPRDAKYKLAFRVVVKNGKAKVMDAHVANDEDGKPVNTINDPALESCFFQHVSRYEWDANEDMPDGYVIPDYEYPDELVIRPERSKKYYKSNMDYVGDEAPAIK
jgi:hypothetical protein